MRQRWEIDDLIEGWTLDPDQRNLVANKTGATRLGFAIYVDEESTASLIEPMLVEHHDLCFEILTWFAWEDNNTGSRTFVTGMGPPLPSFIPAEPIISAVQARYPDLSGLDELKARAETDPDRRLAATFLVASGL